MTGSEDGGVFGKEIFSEGQSSPEHARTLMAKLRENAGLGIEYAKQDKTKCKP